MHGGLLFFFLLCFFFIHKSDLIIARRRVCSAASCSAANLVPRNEAATHERSCVVPSFIYFCISVFIFSTHMAQSPSVFSFHSVARHQRSGSSALSDCRPETHWLYFYIPHPHGFGSFRCYWDMNRRNAGGLRIRWEKCSICWIIIITLFFDNLWI